MESTISFPIVMRLLTSPHSTAPVNSHIDAELRYSASDPYAVTALFEMDSSKPVPWVFARDLLTCGLDESCGAGDVSIWPNFDPMSTPTIGIRLRSREGDAVVETPVAVVEDFLARTWSLVPTGCESQFLHLDEVLDSLLDRA